MSNVGNTFDVASFASAQFEGKNDTRRLQLAQKPYRFVIEGPFGEDKKTRIQVSKNGNLMLTLAVTPEDPEQMAALNLTKMPTIYHNIFLDATPQGTLDMGPFKNADLGKLREALGMNVEGQPWSFQGFVGRAFTGMLEYRPNEQDPENPFANITKMARG